MANLTQDQLNALYQMYGQQGLGGNTQINGQYFAPSGVQSTSDAGVQNALNGFSQYDPNKLKPGDSYQYYDPTGQDAGTRQWENGNDSSNLKLFLAAVGGLAMLPGGFLASGMGGAGAGLGAEVDPMMYGGTGASTWGAGDAALGATGASYTTLPDGTISSLEADMAPEEANGTLSKAALDGTTSFGANSVPGAYDAGAGAYGASTIPSVTVNAATGTAGALTGGGSGSWLSSLGLGDLSGAGSWLAPILGGVLGSQPQKTTDTSSKTPWAPLIPYLTGQNGLFNQGAALAQKQQANQGGWDQMSSLGQSMMQAPAGNGYSMFGNNKVTNPASGWSPLPQSAFNNYLLPRSGS